VLLVVVPLRKLVLVLVSKVGCPRLTRPEGELIGEVGGRSFGADTPIVGVPARKDAPLLGAAMVGVIAVVVGVVDAKAPIAKLPERALRFWVVGVCLVALEAVGVRGGLTVLTFAQYRALVALCVIIVVFILGPFAGNETGDGASRGSGRAALVEVGNKVGADGGMGEMTLGVQKLTLKLLLIVLDGDLLPLAALCLVNVRAVPMDISNDARVFEVSKGLVNKGAGGVGRMKNVVVHIFGTGAIEVGGREGSCVERKGVDDTTFLASAHESGLIPNWLIGDVLGGLGLTELVDEDEWIMSEVSRVKLLPALTRVISIKGKSEGVVTRAGDGDRASGKAAMDDRGRRAGKWLFFVHVTKKDVSEGGDVEEVEDIVVLLDVDVKGLILEFLVGEYCDGGEEAVGPSIKSLGQK
jgi:hypothetical protein